MNVKLEGRVAIVTGANGGIGGAIVDTLVASGCNVVTTDLKAARIARRNGISHFVGDMTDHVAREAVIAFAQHAFGGIDILVNNAGVLHRTDLFATTEEMWDQTMDVNVKSYFFLSQAFAKALRATGRRGSIVNMASIAADVLQNTIPAYAVSKGAVRTLTYALAAELGPLGIRVNAIAPGTIQTDINRARWDVPGVKEKATAGVPLRRLGQIDDIGPAVAYLASDHASFVTGSVLVVDGGRSHSVM